MQDNVYEVIYINGFNTDLFVVMEYVMKIMRAGTKKTIREFGFDNLTIAEVDTLLFIGDGEKSMKDIITDMSAANSTPTRVIDSLVKKGLTERFEDLGDRRKVMVRLTETGAKIFEQIYLIRKHMTEKALEGLSENDREKFMDTVNFIVSNLEKEKWQI